MTTFFQSQHQVLHLITSNGNMQSLCLYHDITYILNFLLCIATEQIQYTLLICGKGILQKCFGISSVLSKIAIYVRYRGDGGEGKRELQF